MGGVLVAHAQVIPQLAIEDLPVSTTSVSLLIDQVSHEKGMPDDMAKTFKAVAWCESHFQWDAVNLNDPGGSYGVFQISRKYHPEITIEQAENPVFAVNWAADQFLAGRASMWSCTKIVADRAP